MTTSNPLRGSVILIAFSTLAVGCSGAPNQLDPVSEDVLLEGSLHMKSLFQRAGDTWAIKIDLGDDRQYQFLKNRMRASGITPETAPRLYAGLLQENQRNATSTSTSVDPPRCDMFIIPTQLIDTQFSSLARGTCIDGAIYSYIDQYQYDQDGTVLGYDFTEQWNGGIAADVNLDSVPTSGKAVWADGVAYQETSTTVESYYFATKRFDNNKQPGAQVTGTLTAPVDVTADNKIALCLERNTDSTGCDYKHTNPIAGGPCSGNHICKQNISEFPVWPTPYDNKKLYIPISGYSGPVAPNSPSNPFVIDYAKAWLTLRSAGSSTGAGGLCTKDLTGSGIVGLVPVPPNNNRLKVVIDAAAPEFGNRTWPDHCVDHGKQIDLNIEVKLRQQSCIPTGSQECFGPAVRWTTGATAGALNPPPMVIYWGCLPSGTEITLANGVRVPIEKIAIGEQVTADERGRILTVIDVVEGVERKPLVRVLDDRGNAVSMTTTHAVPTVDARVIQAQELQIGDRILTKDGPTTVVAVERPEYEGSVYNLILGTAEELATVRPEETTMFANGVLVGDGRMQGVVVQTRSDEAARARSEASLPEEFKADFLISKIRQQMRASK